MLIAPPNSQNSFFARLPVARYWIATGVIAMMAASIGCGDRYRVAQPAPAGAAADSFSSDPVTPPDPILLEPDQATETAPAEYQVKVETTKGDFIIEVTREWSPNGADRFYNLVKIGFFDDVAIFRAIEGFMFQFGIHGNPAVAAKWDRATIADDPPQEVSNTYGSVSFAKTGAPNSRSTQLFINLGDNSPLDMQGFTPIGRVTDGIEVIDQINTEYGENSEEVQPFFQAQGNAYIRKNFPNADFIKSMKIVQPN